MPLPQSVRHQPEAAAIPNQQLQGYLEAGAGPHGKRKIKPGGLPPL